MKDKEPILPDLRIAEVIASYSLCLDTIKEDIVGALITLGINSLSNEDKIKECDNILNETINYINTFKL